ncbi:hypothetical protein GLW00_13660 [Halobacillus litoralis]|uniref:Competence protein ComG n=1 Tax=Halobacillus litoralis TaxID=45668 RepID=A0A845FDJ4_9BACI|nr:hypothetical protein [Halobacillus litoralis]MYL71909.1 hypothetical protein [Halobacillus litoralis]
MTGYTREKSTLHNDHGIVFPWMLILCFLLLIVTLTTTNQYKNHLYLVKSHQASVIKQHILDTSRLKLNTELKKIPKEQMQYSTTLHTPDGESAVECSREEIQWECLWHIIVNSNSFQLKTFQIP